MVCSIFRGEQILILRSPRDPSWRSMALQNKRDRKQTGERVKEKDVFR